MRCAKDYEVPIISTETLKREKDSSRFARKIVEEAKKSHDFRQALPRDIPQVKEMASLGFSHHTLNVKTLFSGLQKGMVKGLVIFAGSNNVKYTQDQELAIMAQEFLKKGFLCFSKGEASIGLAKYGLLNPSLKGKYCGNGLSDFLSSLGKDVPSVVDIGGGDGCLTDLLLEWTRIGKKEWKEYPMVICYPEANRSAEVTEALGWVAMGISTYFWPALPVVGSERVMDALTKFCSDKFGARLMITTEKKMEARAKANWILRSLAGEEGYGISGKPWK